MSSSIAESMDQILDRFDDAWNDPTPPRIEDYLAKAAPGRRLALLIELVRIDLERRLAAGEKVRLEEMYLPRFPELFAEPPAIITLAKHEFAVRRRNEPDLMPAEYLARFPQCQTELVAQLPTLDEIPVGERQSKTAEAPAGLDLRGYELIETLGKGGMGEVYRCVDPALGRDLAIKVMKPEYRGRAEAERRFLREARVTGSLQHPGIVPIHNLGRLSDGRLHYTMRLVRGQTFADILQEEAGTPERVPYLLSIFEKICQAVAYAHSKRVIHRDLKPHNVMVGKFGEVQVMDWGLAKVLTPGDVPTELEEKTDAAGTRIVTEADTPVDLSRMGSGMGTPAYMPPEQALGEWDTVDERADVFALGSILCAILTGQPAYSGTDGNEVYRRAKRGDMSEALQRLQQCSADAALTLLCRECLGPSREDRPRDAAAVAKRVAAYQAEVQERLRRAEVERAQAQLKAREGRKQRRLLIALVLALLAGGALSTWQAVRATAERDDKENALVKAEAATEAERQAKEAEALQRKQAKESEQDTKAVLAFFQEKVLSAGRPRGHEGALGMTVTLRQAVDQAAKGIADSFKDRPLVEASIRDTLGLTYSYLGEVKLSIEQNERALALREDKLGADHPDTLISRSNLALAYLLDRRTADAVRHYDQILKQREAKLGPEHTDTIKTRHYLAKVYQNAGRIHEAIPLFERTLKQAEASLGSDHPLTLLTMNNLSVAYKEAGRLKEAIPLLETILERALKRSSGVPENIGWHFTNLAKAHERAGEFAKAEAVYRDKLEEARRQIGAEDPYTAGAMAELGSYLLHQRKYTDAEPLLRDCLKVRTANQPDAWNTFNTRSLLGAALLGQKKYTDAEPLLLQGYEGMKTRQAKIPPQGKIRLTEALERLVQLYEATQQKDKAAAWRKKLQESKNTQKKPKP